MQIDHPNVIKFIAFDVNGTLTKRNGTEKAISYVVMEFLRGGSLFDFLFELPNFSDGFCRYFFRQIIEGLEACHKAGVVHRNLKPENIVLDENFNIKIIDFSLAGPAEGREGQGWLSTRVGTECYMAPELITGDRYDGAKVDIFEIGVLLFIMYTGHPPFSKAAGDDYYYKHI